MSAEEIVDIVDDADQVIGRAARSEMRRRGLRHRCVYIFLFNGNDQLLIHRRTSTKDVYPGFWDVAVGGVVVAGEGYDACARRELAEEVGIASAELRRVCPFRYEDNATQVNGVIYVCRSDAQLRLQREEVEETRWVRADDLPRLLTEQRFCPDGIAALERLRAG